MELIGVPAYQLVRSLAPPLVLLAVAAYLIRRRRPSRPGLVWAAVGVNLGAAALPYVWLLLQATVGIGGTTLIGFIMTLIQPALVLGAWLLMLGAVFAGKRSADLRSSSDPSVPDEMLFEEADQPQSEGRRR
ncbi:hypothetical protein O4J56_13540 [Nocardiopsis sp. RSe5-2]|uniref:Uncharacterized protein n=1 Tax=Nocardiopsis endophytica TaxID=3018445 RepID=A0ABT4U3X6_9ACTN|nr:hypothetical protein [Nocardiopsis endophytica]MDA2811658.1 hypothetical protein [Nocardiopsis endophytica]